MTQEPKRRLLSRKGLFLPLCLVLVAAVLAVGLLRQAQSVERAVETTGSSPAPAGGEAVEPEGSVEEVQPVRILKQFVADDATFPEVQCTRDRLYVAETFNQRVMIFDAATKELSKEFRTVGSGELEFNYPRSVRVDKTGNLYVLESGNMRVQVVSAGDEFSGTIPLDYFTLGLAVDKSGAVCVAQPQRGSLVSVFSRDGQLLRSFGRLKEASEVFGPDYAKHDESHKLQMNVSFLDNDADGNIYVAFAHLPIIQKYRSDGTLIWEKRLKGPSISWLEKALWDPPKEPGLLKMNAFRVVLVIVIKSISYDPVRKLEALLMGDDTIWILNPAGDVVKVLEVPGYNKRKPPGATNPFWKLTMYDGTIWLSTINSQFFTISAVQ